MEETTKKPRGGKREGSGRKLKGGVGAKRISYRINLEHLALIEQYHPDITLSEFLDRAVKEKLRREGLA